MSPPTATGLQCIFLFFSFSFFFFKINQPQHCAQPPCTVCFGLEEPAKANTPAKGSCTCTILLLGQQIKTAKTSLKQRIVAMQFQLPANIPCNWERLQKQH